MAYAVARVGAHSVAIHLLMLALAAGLLGLAFPRPGWGALAHVALVPALLLALRSTSWKRLLWTSYLVSLTWWLLRLSWLVGVTGGGYAALCAYLALYLPAFLLLFRFVAQRFPAAYLLTVPLLWVSLEWIRGTFLQGGFGWFALGHTQASFLPEHSAGYLVQTADLFGEWTVSFLVAMTNGLIVDLLSRPLVRQTAQGTRRYSKTVRGVLLVWGVTLAAAMVYGGYRRTQASDQRGIHVGVIQTNVPQSNRNAPTAESLVADWQQVTRLTLEAGNAQPRPALVVWPETVVPTALNPTALQRMKDANRGWDQFDRDLRSLASMLGLHLLVGAHADLDAARHNSAYLYLPTGEQHPERYDKIHLVPFGEYIPWVGAVPALKRLFLKYLSPYGDFDYGLQRGQRVVVWTIEAVRVSTPICFEDAIARACRAMVYGPDGSKRVDLLVNLTNDGWYAQTHQGPQHVQIATLRCIENRVPMVRSVNTGISGHIDAVGRVGPLVEVDGRSQNVAGFVVVEVRTDPRRSLFGRVGQVPVAGVAGATGLLVVLGLFRKRRS